MADRRRRPSDYRTDMAPWSRCVAELIRLATALPQPGGLERLREFTAGTRDFCEEVAQIKDGVLVVTVVPTARTLEFLDDLRARAGAAP